MRISYFRIENFRNIRLAECDNPPAFIVICGGNGCGKSALLQALMTAKENAAPYGGFHTDPRSVSADAPGATIRMRLQFSAHEREWYQDKQKKDCPEFDDIVIEIKPGGSAKATKRSDYTRYLLSWYAKAFEGSPGFFDYIDAHRFHAKKELSTWDASSLSDHNIKNSLGARGQDKFQFTKEYLASLVMSDLQVMAVSQRAGATVFPDSLAPIRKFFNDFFAPMEFVDVHIDSSPFKYIVRTPRGEIDIDDLSAGEKEILNTYIRFHQLQPRDAVILFDEADAHLHPDLERRYLEVLRNIGHGNQVWLTTHSPEMMIEAGTESLFTVLKEPPSKGGNQFVQVTTSEHLHQSLTELMGSRGLVSFNQRIIFVEGNDASTDRLVYERLYPPGQFNVTFVPAGNSATVRRIAERVNDLLTAGVGFQQFYSIVDGDLERAVDPPAGERLHRLPVYHVENLLLNSELLLAATRDLLGEKCPYATAQDLESELKRLLVEDGHIKPYAKALLDARVASVAKDAWDAIYKGASQPASNRVKPEFSDVETDAKELMNGAASDGTWRIKCKGRDLLNAFCGKHGIKSEQFRNLLLTKMLEPPTELREIMDQILKD